MKKIMIAMLVIASYSAVAQEGHKHGPRHSEDPLTPEQVATLKTKRMTLALDLSKAQQEEVQKLHLENARLRKEKMEARKEERDDRSRKDLSSDERFSRESERLDHMIASKEKMKKILNEEQFEKWEKAMHHKKHHRPKGDRDGRGRH
ncbi:hypothetical protein [Muriicola marianensis]|uniref:DUF4890 domain-containing protein n=1 Tax=Muriicola marianensis TaxID=1324801 RepID=A0ABQ1R2X8_9FLAO|nr:hypothetical protein [Muriicola marianensis]GGD54419.1 hypothetical protein GCM10011361_21320 [Muriicola marianensis]